MITVFGASGFIGRHVVAHLASTGRAHRVVDRAEPVAGRDLGDVIYCIGVTADFRRRPFDTVRAHVSHLADILEQARVRSLLYLSSTRIYRGDMMTTAESNPLTIDPGDPSQLYDATKAMGESLCLTVSASTRIARLSNVFGSGAPAVDFLPSVVQAATTGQLTLQTGLDSEKDYVSVEETAAALVRIALGGRERIYNVGSGHNVSHRAIVERLVEITGCSVTVAPGAPTIRLPRICVERIQQEFGFASASVLEALPRLVQAVRAS